jgi:hypothetical protein
MKDKDYFDTVLKSVIEDSTSDIEASRDVFNEAWNKQEKNMSKRKYSNMRYIRKVVLVPACFISLVFIGTFTFSPGARAAAQEALKTIFLLDKSGHIEEKSEDTEIVLDVGPAPITNENKGDMERRLGFKVNLPEKIGDYRLGSHLYGPGVNIVARGVKYNEQDKILDKLKKGMQDDKIFEELKKDYNMSREVTSIYLDNQGHEFNMYISKDIGEPLKDDRPVIKELNINDTECIILQSNSANYNVKENADGVAMTDMEHKPISTEERYDMYWKYDGVSYYLNIGKKASDIDAATEFAKDYIKILKQE